jgi:hypothetical protein
MAPVYGRLGDRCASPNSLGLGRVACVLGVFSVLFGVNSMLITDSTCQGCGISVLLRS